MTTLKDLIQQFTLAASIDVGDSLYAKTAINKLKTAFELWLSGKSPLPPTWRSFYQVLRELNLEEMIPAIVKCLASKDLRSSMYGYL